MVLGRNDAALSPTFIEGLTFEGPIGHAGKICSLLLNFGVFLFDL